MKLLQREIEAIAFDLVRKGKAIVESDVRKLSKSKSILSQAKAHSALFHKLPDYIKGRETWTVRDCALELAEKECKIQVRNRVVMINEITLLSRECKSINEIKNKINPVEPKENF